MRNISLNCLSQMNKNKICEQYVDSFESLDINLSFAVIDGFDKMLGFALLKQEDAPIENLCI